MKFNKKNYIYRVPYTIYPKEYIGIILWAIFTTGLSLFFSIFAVKAKEDIELNILALIFLCLAIYCLRVSYCLIKKKVSITITDEYLVVKKIFSTKRVNINDISYIHEISGGRGLPIVNVRCHNTKEHVSFPTSWFSLKDIRKMKEILKDINKNITFS